MPNYRFFFGNKIGKGFFLEGHVLLGKDRDEGTYRTLENPFAIGAGLTIGGKFTRNRLIAEPFLGLGKPINNYDGTYRQLYPRMGVNIGVSF